MVPHAGGGRGLHPVFDCRDVEALPKPPSGSGRGLKSIATLSDRGASLKGKKVRVWARVMAVYPNILGVNWLRLCDVDSGDVLVVSSSQWAHPGMPVLAEGRLALEKNIGNAYTFPLLLEEATLKGDAVLDHAPGHPGPARNPGDPDDPVDL